MTDRVMKHRTLDLDGHEVFYREAGPIGGPVLLALHGYPCSSFEFRSVGPLIADVGWRILAPDFPGAGYSQDPPDFDYSFDGYAGLVERFLDALGVNRFGLYLHDFGSQIGLRVALRRPQAILSLIVQNGDIYEDTLGPRYAALKRWFVEKTPEAHQALEDAISIEGFRDEFENEVDGEVKARLSPDLWQLHWALTTPQRRAVYVGLMEGLEENLGWFDRYQTYVREYQPPTLIVWGPLDGYMPEPSARAWLRDLPHAELHLFPDGGHWLLETHLDAVAPLIQGFLRRLVN